MDSPSIQYTRTEDGVNIAYTVERNGPGTPVMIVNQPAFPLDAPIDDRIDDRSRALRAGRMAIRFDPRCQGLSNRHAEDISLAARELDFLAVQRAAGAAKLAIQPSGRDAWSATAYACHHPESVSHLLLIAASSSGKDYWNRPVMKALQDLANVSYEAYTEAYAWLVTGRTSSTKETIQRRAAAHRAAIDQADFIRLREADMRIDVTEELQHLACPVLVSATTDVTLLGNREQSRKFAAEVPAAHLISPSASEQFEVMARFIDEDAGQEPEITTAEPTPGLRSILFTDIEGHTEMMARLGDERGRTVLREHERITRAALKEHGGTEVKAMGDGFMSWFPSATAALRCASALQKAFEEHSEGGEPIRVRAGINAGEPVEEDDDLFGTSVIVAARTAASAAGGQIVVTDVVRQLVAGKEFLFADRGLSNLKGFEDPVRTWEVLW